MLEKTPTFVYRVMLVAGEREWWYVELGKNPLAKQLVNIQGRARKGRRSRIGCASAILHVRMTNHFSHLLCFYKSSCSVRDLAFFGWRLIPKSFTEINDKVKIRNWVESMGNHLLCMFSVWVLPRGEKHFRKGDAAFFQQLVGGVSFWYYHRWYSHFMDLQMKSKGTMLSKNSSVLFW